MNKYTNPSLKWLEDIVERIHGIDENLSIDNLLAIVEDVHKKYEENDNLSYQEQIPYEVFEKLTELLLQKSEYLVGEELLQALKCLPENYTIIRPLVEQQEILLFNQYNELLEENPNDLEILFKRANYYFNHDEFEDFLVDINKILEISPGHQKAIQYRIVGELKKKNYLTAYQELNILLNKNPDDEFALFERASLYVKLNYSDLAVRDVERLKKTNNIEYLLFCARQLLTNNYIEQSLSISLRILEEVPAQTEALMILGEVYFKKQEYEKSIETFESFIKIINPRVYIAKNHNEKLRAMKYISDSKCKLNRYIDGLCGYLKIMALEGRDYLLIREYVKVTDNLLNKHTKEIDARYLDSILYDIGNLKIIKEYADILCLNNDLRGEFIKHQNNMYDFSMQLDKPSDKKDLLEKVEHLWVEPNMRAEFKQGFPWKVMITDSEDIPYIERLPWVYTVRKLEIIELAYDNKQAICMIFEQNLPALRELKVQAEYFGYLCTKKLVKAPFFEKLESLILTQCNLDAPSLKLIIRNLPLHIKELRLLYCNAEDKLPVEDRVGDLFTLSDRLKELEVLDLTDCSLEKQDVEKILSSNLPCLKSLNLTGNNLMEFDVYEFLKFPLISNLEDLSVGETGLEKNLLWTILDDFKNFKIKKLGVRSDWKKEEMSDIKLHSNFEKLEKVDFGDIQEEEEDWMQFFN